MQKSRWASGVRACSLITAVLATAVVVGPARAGTVTATFEDLGLATDTFQNNAGGGTSGQFVSNGFTFNNSVVTFPGFGVIWSGWAISSVTDNTVPSDFTNQYAAITGTGAGGSKTYAVAFTQDSRTDPFHPNGSYVNLPTGTDPLSMQVTNTAYTYTVITQGDLPYGRSLTQEGDYFRLDITGYSQLNGQGTVVGSPITFDLASYHSGQLHVVNTWQTIDLSSLADLGVRSLRFGLLSTDNNVDFGINTPAYFAMDNLTASTPNTVPEPATWASAAVGLAVVGLRWRGRRRAA